MRLIISADYHLRPTQPRCRTNENWRVSQTSVLRQIVKYANEYKAKLGIVGDIFHTAKVPPWVENLFLRYMQKVAEGVYAIPGNHDLPYHSIKSLYESSFGVISQGNNIRSLTELGQTIYYGTDEIVGTAETGLLFLHTLVFPDEKSIPPNTTAKTAAQLLEEHPDHKWIFTGDMHRSFHFEKNGRHVVNPGCILRQTADLVNYQPVVYFVDTEKEEVIALPLIDNVEFITTEYLEKENERKRRIGVIVEMVRKSMGKVYLDFRETLVSGLSIFDEDPLVKNEVLSILEEAEK